MLKAGFKQMCLRMYLDGCEGWRAGQCQRTVESNVIDSFRAAEGGQSRRREWREFAAGLHSRQPTCRATVTSRDTTQLCLDAAVANGNGQLSNERTGAENRRFWLTCCDVCWQPGHLDVCGHIELVPENCLHLQTATITKIKVHTTHT